VHPFAVKALVVRGEMWLSVGADTRHLRAGDAFELDREVPHAERYGPDGAAYWVARRNAGNERAVGPDRDCEQDKASATVRAEPAAVATSFDDAAATWNKRFGAAHYIFGTEPNEFLREQAHHLAPGGRVLCVADGEGRNSVWLACRGFRVDAFDISALGVAKARKLADEAGVAVNYAVADGDHLQWPAGAYDAVVAVFIQFADPAMRERLFANIVRALERGGVLILQGYTPRQLEYKTGGPPFESHLYTPALLRKAFAALHVVELREYEADLTEGTQHFGRSALIGLVARKP
jgi:SAM-dependent methyltransferase